MPRKKPSYEASLCAGHLLVWTWRKLLAGEGQCPLLLAEYRRIAGDEAQSLLLLFANFLQALGHGSRRLLAIGRQYWGGLTPDEVQMLRLAAAAQTGDMTLLGAHLAWLMKRESQAATFAAVTLLMVRMRKCGVILPEVAPITPPLRPMLEVVWRAHEKPGGDAAGFPRKNVVADRDQR